MIALSLTLGHRAAAQFFYGEGRIEKPRPLCCGPDTVSIIVIGDVMMHARQLEYDYTTFLDGLESRLSAADLAVANMEFTLAGKPYSGYPSFSAPDGYPRYAASCGIDIFLTANNHILDKGKAGIERTLREYRTMEEELDVKITGSSEDALADIATYPLIVPVKGVRVVFVNFTYGTNDSIAADWPKVNLTDRADIAKAMERARAKGADCIIALPHWGTEYMLTHSEEQEDLARWLAGNGADIIIGAHPHVVQDSCTIVTAKGKQVPVFYSTGNAVSNMSAVNTRLGLAVTVKIAVGENGRTSPPEAEAEYFWCTLPGKLHDTYMTVAVKDYVGMRHLWKDKTDYDNMIATMARVRAATGIKGKQ